MSNLKPKIYVACLAAYNSGMLHGKFINAAQDEDALRDEINEMLCSSPIPNAEEFSIHDYEDFGSVELKEYSDLESVSAMAFFIEKHGELGAELLTYNCNDVEEAERLMDECYQGEYQSEKEFAKSISEDLFTIPENLLGYIDFEPCVKQVCLKRHRLNFFYLLIF